MNKTKKIEEVKKAPWDLRHPSGKILDYTGVPKIYRGMPLYS
jgi:hypothetical protein